MFCSSSRGQREDKRRRLPMLKMRCLRLEMGSLLLLMCLLYQKLGLCACLNAEGWALLRLKERVEVDPYGALSSWVAGDLRPCSWFGVKCSDYGRVVALNLKDLRLKGTLAPELGKLIHMRSFILYNNSFYGVIPREIGRLSVLKVLDLGCNSFSEPLPSHLGSTMPLEILVQGSNKFAGDISPEFHMSELQIDEDLSSSKKGAITRNIGNASIRRLLQSISEGKGTHHKHQIHHTGAHATSPSPSPSPSSMPLKPHSSFTSVPPSFPSDPPAFPPSPDASPLSGFFPPAPSSDFQTPAPVPSPVYVVPSPNLVPPLTSYAAPPTISPGIPSIAKSPSTLEGRVHANKPTTTWPIYVSVATGASFLIVLSAIFFLCYRSSKVVTVRPWSTGLSGQLRKAFVTGVPALKRSELEVACEDFSNIVGSLSNGMLYKGTLSSGVEIAVTSSAITSAKDWSKESEAQFRNKISLLSKVNHKNFANLLGFCEEEEPFTRMMVFEYAPNGTLFEHLHIREAEHLDWAARLRITMGIAYCLEHMQQFSPPVVLRNLDSSLIYLTDDFAAKISDLEFWIEAKEVEPGSDDSGFLDSQIAGPEGIVYRYGIILLEILSGKLPFSEDNGLLVPWASSYLDGKRPLKDMIDPTLDSFHEEQLGALCELIRSCINQDPKERPKISEVVSQLREITAMSPDGAAPKLSPLWWAELEIISSEAS